MCIELETLRGACPPPFAFQSGEECTLSGMHPRTDSRNADYAHPGGWGNAAPGADGPYPPDDFPYEEHGGGHRGRPHRRRGRTVVRVLVAVVLVLLVVSVATYFWADSQLRKEVDLGKVVDRPGTGEGTNYLIVGSDSREGMSDQQKKDLHTGSADGKRTDSMMILHDGASGPTLISLPRDSNVTIPKFRGSESGRLKGPLGDNKLNATYSIDGPQLLVRTVEYNTGLHIDHYAEVGFSGFANIVDSIGGVDMNLDKGFKDKWSGADFEAGEQTLNGRQALAFVRTRHAFATSDLERTKNQQKFLSALADQTATPGTLLNPFKLYPTMGAGLDTLIVDKDMNPYYLAKMFFAMRDVTGSDGKSINMPISGSVGGNLQWDKAKVKQLVQELRNDDPVTVTDAQ
ncbi:LCP family protein [Streptomyces asiaticus]|uniref:LCP family protein n=1 Tax=Streptomyces asiaticus TaxID=114695 RepID=UPI003D763371